MWNNEHSELFHCRGLDILRCHLFTIRVLNTVGNCMQFGFCDKHKLASEWMSEWASFCVAWQLTPTLRICTLIDNETLKRQWLFVAKKFEQIMYKSTCSCMYRMKIYWNLEAVCWGFLITVFGHFLCLQCIRATV